MEETLQLFVVDSNASILHFSVITKALAEPEPAVADRNGASSSSNRSDLLSAVANEADAAHAAAEAAAMTRKRESTLLNSALRVELQREASFYLTTMGGVIEGGKHFLKGDEMLESLC